MYSRENLENIFRGVGAFVFGIKEDGVLRGHFFGVIYARHIAIPIEKNFIDYKSRMTIFTAYCVYVIGLVI